MNPTPCNQLTAAAETTAAFPPHGPRPVRLCAATARAASTEGWVILFLLTLFTASLAVLVLAH